MSTEHQPVTLAARDRLRDQQRLEAVQLHAVLAAERHVAAERERAAETTARARHGVAGKQAELNDAIIKLIAISGLPRTAVLLGQAERDLARLTRSRRAERRTQGS